MDYSDFIKVKNNIIELIKLKKKINKKFKGKKLKIDSEYNGLPKDGRNFEFSNIFVDEGLIEILYEADDGDIKDIECVKWISVDDFVKYVEVIN